MKLLGKIKYAILSVAVLSACDFGDTNLDPTSVSEGQVTLPLILPKAEIQSAYNLGATSGRIAGIWMQYFRGVEAQQNAITNYNSDESDVNNTWEFQLYVGSMRDNINIIDKATEAGNRSPYYAGIARVLLAQNLGFATQLWGDIPYSEAFQGSDNLKPVYDTQEDIFASIQTLLDSAILNFQQPAEGVIPGDDDLIFGGNITSWINTARSLKARYYLMLSERNGNAAYNSALTQINAGVLADANSGQPDFNFGEALDDANPIALFEEDRSATLQVDPGFADDVLAGDPRAAVYFSFDSDLEINLFAGSSLYWGRNESPLPLISYAEVKFIEAEALLQTGDVAGADEALTEAIKANMHQVGVDSSTVGGYLTANADLTGAAPTNRLDIIITEKYKALYVQGMVEIWSDYRRTGLPSFIEPEPGAAEDIIPRRLVYPQQENLTNAENVAAATDRQGGATLVDDMWAFE